MIQVGEVLDKYELLERVGQGGMAIVYRGLDRSLKRVVAVKILHGHLSDYQEARDRFEREAQAVAKLRHENILEIFDFAAREGESYIVTEFIEGQTLKQLITERPIAFPEIGAMLIVQVCRALVHAHAGKVLHRDIKPENIMIRSDGVVKLMDFGISHMVDLERLTVTGQLLGSPAYMAPEHVEGRPLDFRTDIFAVGIVLYQLCVGKLPFEGKNPHEVLKRIAECKFIDPRQANPRIGNRLGRIILRAMSARPEDRFPVVGDMLAALDAYLVESGLAPDKVIGELGRYFNSPAPYEQALTTRLTDALTREGSRLLDEEERSAALDVFDRVLTIDDKNERVLAILDGLNRKKRSKQIALGAAGLLALATGAYAIHLRAAPPIVEPPPSPDAGSPIVLNDRNTQTQHDSILDGGNGSTSVEPDAIIAIGTSDAATAKPDATNIAVHTPDAPPEDAAMVATTMLRIVPSRGTQYKVLPNGAWTDVPKTGDVELALDAPTEIAVKSINDCCQEDTRLVTPGKRDTIALVYLSATFTPVCDDPNVAVEYEGKSPKLGSPISVPFGAVTYDSKMVRVKFVGPSVSKKEQTLEVHAGKFYGEVKCEPR